VIANFIVGMICKACMLAPLCAWLFGTTFAAVAAVAAEVPAVVDAAPKFILSEKFATKPLSGLLLIADQGSTAYQPETFREGARPWLLHDLEKRQPIAEISVEGIPIVSDNSRLVAYVDEKSVLHVYDTTTRIDIAHRIRGGVHGYPVAISATGHFAIIKGKGTAYLMDLAKDQITCKLEHFGDPSDDQIEFAEFTSDERFALFHMRPPDDVSGAGYQLHVLQISDCRVVARLKAWPSNRAHHYSLARSGRFFINGDYNFNISKHDIADWRATALFGCIDAVGGHWLEMRLALNEEMFAVWSWEHDTIVLYDLGKSERRDVHWPPENHFFEVLSFDENARYLFIRDDIGVHTYEIGIQKIVATLPLVRDCRTRMSANGRTLFAYYFNEGQSPCVEIYRRE
jgi:hypothetical protein